MKGRKKGESGDELSLFKELRKHQNERVSTFTQYASQDYEYNSNGCGSFPFYKVPSGKKEELVEFMVETNKNDYDWLKTPPATPLFPSLEMEPSSQLVIQKEITISQSNSRFVGTDLEGSKGSDGKSNHTNSYSRAKLAMRTITPSYYRQRTSIIKNKNEQQQQQSLVTKKSNNTKTQNVAAVNNTKCSSTPKQSKSNNNFLALNIKKMMEGNARAISTSVKSRVKELSNIVQLSNVAPPNLRTDQRSSSITRACKVVEGQKHDPTKKSCRASQKERFTTTIAAGSNNNENRGHVRGSKMVEKVVNARKHGVYQVERNKTKDTQI